ncbi:Uncharacterised protein [Mycobacteroides abscessus subsp. abscessus]|nr:Uncharacterised protein [Mycobacteroides abscessus subsp. abscessus]
MQCQRTRVGAAEGVSQILDRHLTEPGAYMLHRQSRQRVFRDHRIVGGRTEHEVVGNEWMHAVHRHKFFGERVRDIMQIGRRAGNAAYQCVASPAPEELGDTFAE